MQVGKMIKFFFSPLSIVTLGFLSLAYSLATETVFAAEQILHGRTFSVAYSSEVLVDGDRNTALEQQARELYERGQFKEAIAVLLQTAEAYAARGEPLDRARVARNLALVYARIGEREKANRAITESFNFLCGNDTCYSTESIINSPQLLAQVLELQGQLQLSGGQAEEALETWKKAADIYREIGEVTGLTRNQINQAQALRSLGLYRRAITTLNKVQENLQAQPDTLLKAKALQSLGDALQVVADLKPAREVLLQSLAIARKFSAPDSIASTLLSLGNTAKLQEQPQAALDFYRQAEFVSLSPILKLQAQLNELTILLIQKQWNEAKAIGLQIQNKLNEFPLSQSAVYARINLAKSLMKMRKAEALESGSAADIAELLATAVQQAQQLEDPRTLSYALGNLGRLYEQNQQHDEARELTEKALLLAQSINASEIAYQWQWQLGRVSQIKGRRAQAIAAYTAATNTLKSLRNDLVAINSETQFDFRDSVEPVYRELVALLLKSEPSQDDLKQAREAIEALQVAELDNFFRDACLDTQPVQIDQIDPQSAIFYPIILPDRLEVIVTLPGQPLQHYTTQVSQQEVESTLESMLDSAIVAKNRVFIENFWSSSQKIYDWIIRPIEIKLQASKIQNLVFVSDGALRNIPLSSLYDGERYLVEKYSVAIAPSLQLVDSEPLARDSLKIFAAGLTKARQGFAALPGVEVELASIQAEIPTEELLDGNFTTAQFEKKVNAEPFRVIHLATHGEFSSNAEDTFILTWDDRITAKKLELLLRHEQRWQRPIELLVLSACRTAAGDNRAALGLAGVSVRAGARATVASLWYVDDEATTLLMTHFYQELANNKEVTKAEALRRAQQVVLQNRKFAHPYFWSAFVMVGNWL